LKTAWSIFEIIRGSGKDLLSELINALFVFSNLPSTSNYQTAVLLQIQIALNNQMVFDLLKKLDFFSTPLTSLTSSLI